MNSGITYPFIQSELELRREQARSGTVRRPRTRRLVPAPVRPHRREPLESEFVRRPRTTSWTAWPPRRAGPWSDETPS